MSTTVISAKALSKQYHLGQIGTGSLAHDLNRWWHQLRGKENPYLRIGDLHHRDATAQNPYVWSLKDLDFDIQQGDAVGIIGRNGAGKSTLLKILSQVTAPTTGSVKIKGRIASLLEVGTGFHPELSGRENIYLNGAILGMRKQEVKRHFDEMVDFSGVERYIDTPVKRYSSGMYVRLAFAVAAHLESEILIVDEVLAVGDSEFQQKCLGKMNDVSKGENRTVLFVSHNMAAVKTLCRSGMVLNSGELLGQGDIDEMIRLYQHSLVAAGDNSVRNRFTVKSDESREAQVLEVAVTNAAGDPCSQFDVFDDVVVHLVFTVRVPLTGFTPILCVQKDGGDLFWSFASDLDPAMLDAFQPGRYHYKIKLPVPFKKGFYSCSVRLGKLRVRDYDLVENAVEFFVDEFSFDPTSKSFSATRPGLVPAILAWEKLTSTHP